MDLDSLRELMTKRLNDSEEGIVLCDISQDPHNGESDEQRLSKYLSSRFGLSLDPAHIRQLTPEVAQGIAERVIAGLSYPSLPRTPSTDREQLLDFLAHFAPARRYYSPMKYTFGPHKDEITRTGYRLHVDIDLDEGILVIDETKVGIVWMADSG